MLALPRFAVRARVPAAARGCTSSAGGWLSTRADHAHWINRVRRSQKLRPPTAIETASTSAPFLRDVEPLAERLRYYACPVGSVGACTPSASFLEVVWPVSTDEVVSRNVSDLTLHRSPPRLMYK